MHGLIFVTWEKYLSERFGHKLLYAYRELIGETITQAPLTSHLYDDATLLAGVAAASKLTQTSPDILLREYGRYFIVNGLTSHLCTYVLADVTNGRDLLLKMRDVHARLRQTETGLTPPLFNYESSSNPNEVILLYDSPRQICSVLWGAIEGAAERYGEQVTVVEHNCMKHGAAVCRFEVTFYLPASHGTFLRKTPEQITRQQTQKRLADLVLKALPPMTTPTGMTLLDLQQALQRRIDKQRFIRPASLFETLQHLQFAGLVASTGNQPGDTLFRREYWRVQTYWT